MKRNPNCRLVAVICAFFFSNARQGAATAGASQGLLEEGWKPLCKLSNELDTIPNDIAHDTQQILDRVADMNKAALRVQIFITATTPTLEVEPFVVLSSWLQANFDKAASLYRNAGTISHLKTTKASSYLKGRIDEALSFLAESYSTTNNGCLLRDGTTTHATPTGDRIYNTACPCTSTEIKPGKATATQVSATRYPNLIDTSQNVNSLQGETDGSRKCHLLSGHSSDSYAKTQAIEGKPTLFGGYINIPKTASAITAKSMKEISAPLHDDKDPWKTLVHAKNNAHTEATPGYTNTTDNIQTQPSIIEAVTRNILGKDTAEETAYKPHITRLFGESGDTKVKGYLKLVDDFQIPNGVAGIDKKTPLRDIKKYDKLIAILGHYQISLRKQVIALEKKAETASNTKPNTGSEAECNKLDNEEKCNADKKMQL
uniref:Variant surface glycoprotein 1125.1287 n=1 Tax=Trypanosoma brucei TaxID=5691 RepID=A0A1J0R6K7_9TRYP|nr:variant surface glycoprotein 1125.1287 [Trypanosoma brucei]